MDTASVQAVADVLRRQMVMRWWDGGEAIPDLDAIEVVAAIKPDGQNEELVKR